jgi:hypothetical protein
MFVWEIIRLGIRAMRQTNYLSICDRKKKKKIRKRDLEYGKWQGQKQPSEISRKIKWKIVAESDLFSRVA